MRLAPVALAAAMAALTLLLAAGSTPASGNGVPQTVNLTYIKGLSNYGAQDAEGTLEFSFAEGYAKATVQGLTVPEATQSYQCWLVKSTTGAAVNLGVLEVDADGQGTLDVRLPALDNYSYDLFILTVEESLQPVAKQSALRSVGGFFTIVAPSRSDVPGPDTQPGVEESGAKAPEKLPDTGAVDVDAMMLRSLLVMLTVLFSVLLAVRATRKMKGGRSP